MRASSSVAAAGNASSTSRILFTGLKTCSATKRSGRPLAAASSSTDSEEVVVARTASSEISRPSRASTAFFTAASSTTASTTNVASPSASASVTTLSASGISSPSAGAVSFSSVTVARRAETGDRAHSTTCPCSAATAARPQAITPLPTMPSVSSSAPPIWLTRQSTR